MYIRDFDDEHKKIVFFLLLTSRNYFQRGYFFENITEYLLRDFRLYQDVERWILKRPILVHLILRGLNVGNNTNMHLLLFVYDTTFYLDCNVVSGE